MIGFLIALPVGPVAIVCLRRTLTGSKRHGIVSGLGAATADSLYGAMAALGLSLSAGVLEAYESWFNVLGGLALCLLGVKTFLSKGKMGKVASSHVMHAGNFVSTFLLTLMNPMTMVAFAVVYASYGVSTSTSLSAASLITGVFCGSGLWWLALCFLASSFSSLINEEHIGLINKIAGVLILVFGVIIMFKGIVQPG